MCTRPVLMQNEKGYIKLCPCNICIECRTMRREDFKARMKMELESYNYLASFITLTYSDNNLVRLLPEGSAVVGDFFGNCPPAFGSVVYRPHLSKFCDKMQKRLRRKYGRSGKYIGFADYGSDTHRPHYHLIYIGCPNDRHLVYDTWNLGNIDVQPVGNGCIRYVLDYICKMPLTADNKYKQFGDFEPPFYHFSKGLGFDYIEKNLNKFNEFGELEYNDSGKKVVLNPYLKEKYGFLKRSDYYPKCVVNYAKEHHLSLEQALEERSRVQELSLQRKLLHYGKPLYNVDTIIKNGY